MTTYTIQYSSTEYVNGMVTYRARLMLENTIPVLISDRGHRNKHVALVQLADKYIEQILDDPYSHEVGPQDPNFVPLSLLPTDLSEIVENEIKHCLTKKTQSKIRARIRRREKQSLKERTV